MTVDRAKLREAATKICDNVVLELLDALDAAERTLEAIRGKIVIAEAGERDARRAARAAEERLGRYREALALIAAPKRADGTYNRCREACEALARRVLGPP